MCPVKSGVLSVNIGIVTVKSDVLTLSTGLFPVRVFFCLFLNIILCLAMR